MSAPDLGERLKLIKLAVFDVDGALTDGSIVYGSNGEETKTFNTLDGHGLKMLQASGVTLAIISGRSSQALARRAADLGIAHLIMGTEEKRNALEKLLGQLLLTPAQAAGLGDDVVDLPFLTRCGFSACEPAAPDAVKSRVNYVTTAGGGRGAAREFCELIMRGQGTFDAAISRYLV